MLNSKHSNVLASKALASSTIVISWLYNGGHVSIPSCCHGHKVTPRQVYIKLIHVYDMRQRVGKVPVPLLNPKSAA